MKVSTYAPDEDAVLMLARADQNPQAKPLLAALQIRLAELQAKLMGDPRRSFDLADDCAGIVCEMRGAQWLLVLVREAKDMLGSDE